MIENNKRNALFFVVFGPHLNCYYDYSNIFAVGVGETDIIVTVGDKIVKCHVVVQ